MLKNHKRSLLLSSAIILLPAVFGLIFWNELPAQMTTHWGIDGQADGWSDRFFAVLMLPLIMLLAHWLCIFFTAKDPKNKGQNKKVFGLVLWILPLVSLFSNGMMYAVSFGKTFQPYLLMNLLLGATFLIIGNYLPKCKQNHTIGIKVKWTLENEENWNATHRFSGRLWVAGGLFLLLCMCLPDRIMLSVTVAAIFPLALIPMAYSYLYHRKQVREGTAVITPLPKTKASKIGRASVAIILTLSAALMFSGKIEVTCQEDSFFIEASYWRDLTVAYAAVDRIEYREQDDKGIRTNGLGSARLLAGTFQNEEFGIYTRYSYTGCDACVVLTAGDRTLVLSGPDAERTQEIYEAIKSNLS